MPLAARILLGASLGALGFALIMQYGFGYRPCDLCLWQRAPFGAAAAIALLALLWSPCRHATAFFLFLCAACYLTGMGLAVFHSGVELHWWAGPSACTAPALGSMNTEEMRAALLGTKPVRCDDIAWKLFGLSMANYNVALSLALAVYATLAGARIWKNVSARQ